MTFKLISHGMIFRPVARYEIAGIAVVKGVSLCGRWQTVARVQDVEIIADVTIECA